MYDPTVFARGQQYRKEVIASLAAERIDFYRLSSAVDAGEIIRKSFYANDDVEWCASLIKTAIKDCAR